MQADVRETIAQVRDLAHGIYPPLLRQAGLPEALHAAATRSPNAVTVEVDGVVARHEAEVEAALYFCALEALQNIAKHAPDAAVTVRLAGDAGLLVLEVADDGPGYDAGRQSDGQGRQNMTDRVGAVGGAVRVETMPGAGTVVRAEVPGACAGRLMAPGRDVPWAAVGTVARLRDCAPGGTRCSPWPCSPVSSPVSSPRQQRSRRCAPARRTSGWPTRRTSTTAGC